MNLLDSLFRAYEFLFFPFFLLFSPCFFRLIHDTFEMLHRNSTVLGDDWGIFGLKSKYICSILGVLARGTGW